MDQRLALWAVIVLLFLVCAGEAGYIVHLSLLQPAPQATTTSPIIPQTTEALSTTTSPTPKIIFSTTTPLTTPQQGIDLSRAKVATNPNDPKTLQGAISIITTLARALPAGQKEAAYHDALVYAGQLIVLDPNNALSYSLRGDLEVAMGTLSAAASDYQKALSLDKSNVHARENLSSIQLMESTSLPKAP